MSDAWRDIQFDTQYVELLPARTVLSTFAGAADGNDGSDGMDAVGGLVTHLPFVDKVLTNSHGGSDGLSGSPGGGTSGLS